MYQNGALARRQLWGLPSETTETFSAHCTPFTLPSAGIISFADSVLTLTTDVIFQPECTGIPTEGISAIAKLKDPFYASTTPQTYVIAATTVIAWVLVVMLIITPRTSFIGNPSASPMFGNGRGIIGGATGGGTNMIGVGSRPWLQKVAALTVALSLTIATADTFKVASQQYETGYMNASVLREKVLGSLEIRTTRVISDVFLWLAQVQTLIRLFPRHKEKVLIKWIGFALIVCDSTFSCLNSFLINNDSKPRHFVDAIPALSYLFQMALSLLYAAWVLYYAVTKRRYAFYHSKMRSICLISLLSLIAILTPVVFFVTDVSNQDVAGWGDYFRWVGAAAASVVVWEWVERIEALERDEKKDGILGREIFDGDEMLDVTPSEEAIWAGGRRSRGRLRRDDGDSADGSNQSSALEHGLSGVAQRFKRHHQKQAAQHFPLGRAHSSTTTSAGTSDPANAANANGRAIAFGHLPKPGDAQTTSQEPVLGQPTPPPPVASPVSRAETASAASTVYVVRHDTGANVPQPVRRRLDRDASGNTAQAQAAVDAQRRKVDGHDPEKEELDDAQPNLGRDNGKWYAVPNPFKRKRASPPMEVQQAKQAAMAASNSARATTPAHNFSKWDIKNRIGVLAADTGEMFRERGANRRPDAEVPVTIIPAQPRGSGRTWSPANPDTASTTTAVAAGGGATTMDPQVSNPAPTERPHPAQQRTNPADARSPTIVSAPSRGSNSNPPRADDISPVGGSNGRTVIVPAPRRSPLRGTTSAQRSSAQGSAGESADARAGASRDGGNG